MPEKKPSRTGASACARRIPLSLVLLDNVPTVLLYVLGTVILSRLHPAAGAVFAAYAAAGFVWFWARICPHCAHYDTASCPCGYGAVSARLFKRKSGGDFRRVFRRNIVFVFPLWFAPPAVGGWLLATRFDLPLFFATTVFCVIGFAVIPLVSRLVGCRDCAIKPECPWMNKGG